jgi:pimeloyl-ACP methyl ester carboxylesterase
MTTAQHLFALGALTCLLLAGCGPGVELPPTHTLDADGVKIAYFVQGEGEPVILIHGWLSSAGINWVLPGTSGALAKEFQVVALDIRGHGMSDKPTDEEAYGPELVEDIVRLMDELKIEKAHIVGYSMGGMIASNFVVRHPDRVRSLTLGGMGWMKEGGAAQWFFKQVGKKEKDAKAHAVCGRSLAKLALTEDEIKSIETPVTVLIGADDRVVQKLYVDPLKKFRPDWPVIEITGGGHFTTIVKQQFRDELNAAIKKHAASAPAEKPAQQ